MQLKANMFVARTVESATVNLVKTIVGAGMLAVPYAYRADGVLLTVVLIVLAAFTSWYGLFILAKCSKTLINPRHSSFFTLCSITYPNLSLLFDFAMLIQCFGVALSYLIIIGDVFPALFGGTRSTWITLSALIIVPVSLFKQIDSLRHTSVLAIVGLSYIGLFIIGTYFFNDYPRPKVHWVSIFDSTGILSTFSIIVFAFTGSMNLFSIINELQDNSMTNIKTVINTSIVISAACFIIVGLFGYLTFGENTEGNVMLNYTSNNTVSKVANFSLGFMVILSFPLLFHPCRISANNMIYWLQLNYGASTESSERSGPITLEIDSEEDREYLDQELGVSADESFVNTYQSLPRASENDDETHADENTEAVPFPHSRFLIVTFVLLGILYTLAFKVKSFALVLALVGAVGSTSISFILPGLFGWKLIGTESLMNGLRIEKWDRIHRYASIILTWYGTFVMVACVLITLFL